MKVIDDKGRLFGKINIIDFTVILFLLCILPMFYFGYRIFTKRPQQAEPAPALEKEFLETELDCLLVKLEPQLAEAVSVGDKELNERQEVIGEILELGNIAPYVYELDIGRGQKVIKKDPLLLQVNARLRLRAEVRGDSLYYKDKPIRIGSSFDFKTDRYELSATPTVKEKEKEKEKTVDLYFKLKDLTDETVDSISAGDRELDEDGRVVAEILSVEKIEENSVEINLGSGSFVSGQEPDKNQLIVKMRLKGKMRGSNELYFKGARLTYNEPVEFDLGKYKVKGVITQAFTRVAVPKEKWLTLQARFEGVIPEIAKIIQAGDAERDASGRVVGRVASIITNELSRVLALKEDKFVTFQHPYLRDIVAILEILCVEKDGVYYFKNYPVKIGNNLVFSTELYSLSGVITGLEVE
jgi:hypothetical protein